MTTKNNTTPPVFPNTLINEPSQSVPAANIDGMGPLKNLIGTWTNQNLGTSSLGGMATPYSYNIMPLPQDSAKYGYILKNFRYYEEITISPINGTAPNRGGDYTQTANTVFYEQRVYFADGPAKDQLVHAENGSWLFLATGEQISGPYPGNGNVPPPTGGIPIQSIQANVAKQISVPHGNSILALGGIVGHPGSYLHSGTVNIPNYDANSILPKGIDTAQYKVNSTGNPYEQLNNNPNAPLQNAAKANSCKQYIQWAVDTSNNGSVTNIPFEQKKANVLNYSANYWLQAFSNGGEFTQLAYNQTILMNIPIMINGSVKLIKFPHITCNTLTKK